MPILIDWSGTNKLLQPLLTFQINNLQTAIQELDFEYLMSTHTSYDGIMEEFEAITEGVIKVMPDENLQNAIRAILGSIGSIMNEFSETAGDR